MENSKSKIIFITTQPETIEPILKSFPYYKAKDILDFHTINLRDFGIGKHHSIDGRPAGGGDGMILRVDCVHAAIETAKDKCKKPYVIGLCPKGNMLQQKLVNQLSQSKQDLIFVCGRFGGFDERCYAYFDTHISVGQYVLSSGDLPALMITDSILRQIPGILGNPISASKDSFATGDDELEWPQYTSPDLYENQHIPSVLKSGDPKKIEAYFKAK